MGHGHGPLSQAMFLGSNIIGDIAWKAVAASADDLDQHLVALLLSAAWFEACLNEVSHELTEPIDLEATSDQLKKIRVSVQAAGVGERQISVERRLRVLAAALVSKPLAVDEAPWYEMLLLFRLRNWIVHLRPEKMNVRPGRDDEPSSLVSTQVHELVTALLKVGAINAIPQGHMVPLAMAIRMPVVGPWAYRAAYNGLLELEKWCRPHLRVRFTATAHRPKPIEAR